MAPYHILIIIIISVIPENLVLLTKSEQSGSKSAHIRPIIRDKEAIKVTRPSFLRGYHPTLKLSGIPTLTFIVSLTHRMDNI